MPVSRLAWIVVIFAIPVVGMVAYLLLGETSIGRWRTERMNQVIAGLPPVSDLPGYVSPDVAPELDEWQVPLFNVGRSITGYDPVGGNQADLMADSNTAIDTMVADIDAATAEFDTIRGNFLSSQEIANTNGNLAYTKYASTNSRLIDIKSRISSIKFEASADAIAEVEERKNYYGELLSTLSLAFEASQNLTDFVAANAVLPRKVDPGSVLNLFS